VSYEANVIGILIEPIEDLIKSITRQRVNSKLVLKKINKWIQEVNEQCYRREIIKINDECCVLEQVATTDFAEPRSVYAKHKITSEMINAGISNLKKDSLKSKKMELINKIAEKIMSAQTDEVMTYEKIMRAMFINRNNLCEFKCVSDNKVAHVVDYPMKVEEALHDVKILVKAEETIDEYVVIPMKVEEPIVSLDLNVRYRFESNDDGSFTLVDKTKTGPVVRNKPWKHPSIEGYEDYHEYEIAMEEKKQMEGKLKYKQMVEEFEANHESDVKMQITMKAKKNLLKM